MKKIFRSAAQWSLFYAVVTILAFGQCAREVNPTGGLVDSLPPRIVRMRPENKTVNFKNKKVILQFDEYVSLKSITENLVISPPSDPKPEIRQNGKRLIIDFTECSLADSTTYSLNFGSSITDLNEGNVLAGFNYIFSTGPNLDSLHIKGRVRNVRSGELIQSMTAALYRDLSDSAPIKALPEYLAKTGSDGAFLFNTIKEGSYRMIVFEDLNRNMKYDHKTESIAFYDSTITPTATNTVKYDTIHSRDTVMFHAGKSISKPDHHDTLRIDSIVKTSETVFMPNPIEMYLFTPKTNVQFVKAYERLRREKVSLVFNQPLFDDSIAVSLQDSGFEKNDFILQIASTKDSATIWITDTALLAVDTATFLVRYFRYDSLEQKYWHSDTITPRYSIRKDKFKGLQSFLFAFSARNGNSILPDGSIDFESSLPMELTDAQRVRLYTTTDTVGVKNRQGTFYPIDTAKTEIIERLNDVQRIRYKMDSAYKDQHIVQHRYVPNRFMIRFGLPILENEYTVKLAQMPELENWCKLEFNQEENAIYGWITNQEALRYISPQLKVSYKLKSGEATEQTIILRKGKPGKKRRSARTSKLSIMITKQQQDEHYLDEPVEIIFANPLVSIDTSKISLTKAGDTAMAKLPSICTLDTRNYRKIQVGYKWEKGSSYILSLEKGAGTDIYGGASNDFLASIKTQSNIGHKIAIPIEHKIQQDSLNNKKYHVTAKWDDEKKYRLVIADSAFTDMYGKFNDSTETDFTIAPSNSLSSLEVRIQKVNCPIILEVMDKELKNVLFTQSSSDTGQVVFSFGFIRPAVYGFRLTEDRNNNKKWDTGDYFTRIQPEKMRFCKETLETKANKDHIYTWDLSNPAKEAQPINKSDVSKNKNEQKSANNSEKKKADINDRTTKVK